MKTYYLLKPFKITIILLYFFSTSGYSQFYPDTLYKTVSITPTQFKLAGKISPPGVDLTRPTDIPDYSLYNHAGGAAGTGSTPPQSIWASATESLNIAYEFATGLHNANYNGNGWIYYIRRSPNFVDVNRSLGTYSPHPVEIEWAGMGSISYSQILGWREVQFGVMQNYVANPDYHSRFNNYASHEYDESIGYSFAGFPANHAAWSQSPWNTYSVCGSQASSSRSAGTCSSFKTNNTFDNYFYGAQRKLVFRNLNYDNLSIQLLLESAIDHYVTLGMGQELILTYSNGFYYYNNHKVQSIDLDDGAAPTGAFDEHDNMDFSWTTNGTITYKPKNLFSKEVLIDNYKDLDNAQYREVRDADGINGGAANAIISSYAMGKVQFIEIKKWGSKKFDVSKLQRVTFSNISYDNIGQKRVRLGNNAWDIWPNINVGTEMVFDYTGNGAVKYNGNILQQIDMYWTSATTWYSGDELDFSWHNSQEINYRPYWDNNWANIPVITLVDFQTGNYSSFVDQDGIYGFSSQMFMKVRISDDEEDLYIELHGRASYPSSSSIVIPSSNNTIVTEEASPVKENLFELYPNPVNTELRLVFNKQLPIGSEYCIYDVRGALVGKSSIASFQTLKIDVSEFENGMYFISMIGVNEITKTKKFQIIH